MILNNKSTNPIGYTISTAGDPQRAKAKENAAKGVFDPSVLPPPHHIAVFCGVTGNHPKELLNSAAFIEDCQRESPNEGIEIIDRESKIDPTRAAMNVSDAVKLPDFDVVEYCTKIPAGLQEKEIKALEKKQLHCIENIFKVKTLEEIEKQEKRSNIIQAIERQFKTIETSIRKDARG
jgi:hypothetical protein